MNMRLARPQRIIDINRAAGLDYIKADEEFLLLGALTRHCTIERSELVAAACPMLSEAVRLLGHPQVRSRGTIGGSVAHADPAAEYPVALAALEGEIVVQSLRGRRVVGWQQFFLDDYTVDLDPDELVVEVRLRRPACKSAGAFLEISRRHGDFALVEAAVQMELDTIARCSSVSIALGGVGGTPVRAIAAENLLRGQVPTAELIRQTAALAVQDLEPVDDVHATSSYRKKMACLLVARALERSGRRRLEEGRRV
jgi:CO/xanthine dehydrogenase FAD-binding subunit